MTVRREWASSCMVCFTGREGAARGQQGGQQGGSRLRDLTRQRSSPRVQKLTGRASAKIRNEEKPGP